MRFRKYTNEEIRKFISCPQLGNTHYGIWGSLPLDVRDTLYDLIEENNYKDELIMIKENERETYRRLAEVAVRDNKSEREIRLDQTQKVFHAIRKAMANPCSYRYLIYDLLGFDKDKYLDLIEGMAITNMIQEYHEQIVRPQEETNE